jgi:hypothetical protein
VCSSDARELVAKITENYSRKLEAIDEPMKSLYPRADLDVVGEGFAMTCNDEEALKLIEDSAVMAGHIVDMLPVDMSLG